VSDENDGASAYALGAILDYRAAAPLRDAFLERRGAPLHVDASQVEQMSALCLQVLLAARLAWRRDGVPFECSPRSPAFETSIAAFDAKDALGASPAAE